MTLEFLKKYEFFTGVPDSLLAPFCDYLYTSFGTSGKHIVAANEGAALALALGYHLSTGKIPLVYMQNSGIGNAINPLTSLINEKIYKIPCVFVIGWRGEPGLKDEPQHAFMGEITPEILALCGVKCFIIDKNTTQEELEAYERVFDELLAQGKQVAYAIKKDAFASPAKAKYSNAYTLNREQCTACVLDTFKDAIFISTTGKISRELFELREQRALGHEKDFLCVGGMGHASMIALGIALNKKERQIICLDGDGAFLMHTGGLGTIAISGAKNLIHIVLNNAAHESVGGMPTMASSIDLCKIASGFGYKHVFKASDESELKAALNKAKGLNDLCFIEIKCALGSRSDLARPTTTPEQNKIAFMKELGIKPEF